MEITVLVACSPIPSHPDTEVIDRTVASIRERLPDSEIIFMFDGVAPKDVGIKQRYEEFIQTMTRKINSELTPAVPLVFQEHKHQTGMTRTALGIVDTPLMLFVEQDTPLHNDIPFEKLSEVITGGYANLIRFHHEAQIHPEHEHLMIDHEPVLILGQPLMRTRQWSQRPHLASTRFYRWLSEHWDNQPRFIEHVEYGLNLVGDFSDWRTHIYTPPGTFVRSLHLDGRRYEVNN